LPVAEKKHQPLPRAEVGGTGWWYLQPIDLEDPHILSWGSIAKGSRERVLGQSPLYFPTQQLCGLGQVTYLTKSQIAPRTLPVASGDRR